MDTDSTLYLLLLTVASIGVLLLLVIRFKVHAFVSLILVSAFVGIGAGMSFEHVLTSIRDGMGGILGFVAIIVGLGSILGKLLEVSGGAETLANYMVDKFGIKKAPWALTITGFMISIPVFLDVAFIILVPIVYALSRESKKSTLYYAIPLLAGLAVTHAFIPPTPGPIAVAEILDVNLGWVIVFGAITGIPAAIFAGPVFGKYIGKRIDIGPPDFSTTEKELPSENTGRDFGMILFIILLPLVLIVQSTILDLFEKEGMLRENIGFVNFLKFIGHPFSALTIATLVAGYFLGIKKGFTGKQLLNFTDKALGPAGLIILVTGAGGVFKQILIESGVGEAMAEIFIAYEMAPVVLAYILALLIRVTQGSATVAMVTSAGMMAPVLEQLALPEPDKALVVIAIAAGATLLSHVNDSGFWLVSKYLGLTEKQTLRSWSMMVSIVSVVGFLGALILSFFV